MRSLVSVFGHLFRTLQRVIFTPVLLGWLIVWLAIGCAVGMVIATSPIFGIFRENPGESAWHWLVFAPLMFVGVVFAFRDWLYRSGAESFFGLSGDSHGSARFANRKDLKKLEGPNKLGSNAGLLIGRDPHTGRLLRYDGPAHVLDPFEVTGIPSAAYNPLDRLSPDSLDLGEDAASLTEALVMDAPGQVSEAHWNEEAKAILGGLIMFCVCHEEKSRRSLATVREYLTLPPERLRALLELMQDSDAAGGLVARAASRFRGKADREAASVLSNAQRHTHFLDSPRIARVLSRSDFHFSELRHRITSVFLVLPPNRMDAYSRWLRLLVSQALNDIARDALRQQQWPPAP